MILSTTAVGKHSWAEVTSPPLLTGCYSTCCLPREDLIYLDLKSRLVSMGSEHSKNKDPSKVNQCDKNGGLNGLAENMTSNGLENEAESLTPNQQTSKVAAFNSDADSEYVVMHLDSQQAETQVVPEKPSATSETEEAEKPGAKMHFFDKIFKRKAEPEAPVDAEHVAVEETHENIAIEASLPTTDTQLESSSSREDGVSTSAPKMEPDYLHQAESSTQTERIVESDISTQTRDDAERALTTKVLVGTDRANEPSESDIVIAREAIEELSDNQATGITTFDIINEDSVFRAERVEVTGEIQNPEKRRLDDTHKIDTKIPVKYQPVGSITEIADDVNVSRLQVGEGGSADETLLSETAEPEVIPHDITGRNDIPSANVEPLITMMETISEEEEHLLLERPKRVFENIAQRVDVLEDSSERTTIWYKELSIIDEVLEHHIVKCLADADDKDFDTAPETNAESDFPADGNKEKAVALPSQIPKFKSTMLLEPANDDHQQQANTVVRFVSSAQQAGDSEPTFMETIHKIASVESKQDVKAVLGSVDEAIPIQELSSQCEVTKPAVQAVAYRSELLIKIPAVPRKTVATNIPTKDDLHFEESTKKENEVIDDGTLDEELSSECNVTNTFVGAGFCSQPLTEISETSKNENFTPAKGYFEESPQIKTEENTPIDKSSCEASLEVLAEDKCPKPLDQIPAICKPIVKDAQDEIHLKDFTQLKNGVVNKMTKCEAQITSEASLSEHECFETPSEIPQNSEPTVEEPIISAKDKSHFEETSDEGEICQSSKHAPAESSAISDAPKEENESPHKTQGTTGIELFDKGMFENLDVCTTTSTDTLQAKSLTGGDLDSCRSVHEDPLEENSVVKTEDTKHDVQESLSLMEALDIPEDEACLGTSKAESSVNTTEIMPTEEWSDQKLERQEHMEDLLMRLESSCTSVVEDSPYRLQYFDISSSSDKIMVVIQVAPEEQQ
ncbi:breast carcinoma-amplified sequence 1 isoform X1 [Syngnathus typhle]|uniref:breast carcinoma-amplified sequence 1 isoform X1 n=1 Tax=Syngnathus typhle TaxID=161592 RepID=UPI002A6A0F93|nr:breast carcinoma-amplified sequence 1 isoform X1 [Syngnathus typhle]